MRVHLAQRAGEHQANRAAAMTATRTPEDILRAGIDRALAFLDNKKPGRARYTLTRAVIQYDRAKADQ